MEKAREEAEAFIKSFYADDEDFEHLQNAIDFIVLNSTGTMKTHNEQWCRFEELPDTAGRLLTALDVDVIDVLAEYQNTLMEATLD